MASCVRNSLYWKRKLFVIICSHSLSAAAVFRGVSLLTSNSGPGSITMKYIVILLCCWYFCVSNNWRVVLISLTQCAIRTILLVFQDHVSKDKKSVTHSQERPKAHWGSFYFQMYLCSYWNLDVKLVLFIFYFPLNYLKNKEKLHTFLLSLRIGSVRLTIPLIRFLGFFLTVDLWILRRVSLF
jgi:hypothetical protein